MKTVPIMYACSNRPVAGSLFVNTGLKNNQTNHDLFIVAKPSDIAIKLAAAVFLREGAKKDWAPINGNPGNSYL